MKAANELVRDKVIMVKAEWTSKKAHLVHKMCHSPKDAWSALKESIAGDTCHHNKPVTMKMKRKNGKLATKDKENMEVVAEHLNKVYNTHQNRLADAAIMLKQREEFTELGEQITWKEFLKAITNLKNDKAPGVTGVPPNAFTCLDGEHKRTVFQYINDFWDEKADYWEWHQGLSILVP